MAANIRRRRQELGYTQEGFAQYAGIDRAQYGRIERGEANISVGTLWDLAGHLRLSPERLFKGITLDDCLLAETDEKDH